MVFEMVEAGATIVGGCCGTTPDHIRLLANRLRGVGPSARATRVTVSTPSEPVHRHEGRTGFLADWGKRPIVTVEVDPPRGIDCTKVLEGCRMLKEAGADAVSIAENPLARVRMGNIALGSLIQRETGMEVIVHVTCRDRNLLGLQSDLMGASLLGIRSVLAVTGDPASLGEQADATSVYDLNSFGLIKLLKNLNSGISGTGGSIGRGAGFTIGGAFNPNTPRMEHQIERLRKKIASGMHFVQTQPLYDIAVLDRMLDLTGAMEIPVLPGILPLVSERNTEFLHNEVPGITVPETVRDRMRGKQKEAGVAEGVAIASEFIAYAKKRVGGFYIIPPFGKYEIAAELVRLAKRPA
jgi:homocysteine S-methyltransferase